MGACRHKKVWVGFFFMERGGPGRVSSHLWNGIAPALLLYLDSELRRP